MLFSVCHATYKRSLLLQHEGAQAFGEQVLANVSRDLTIAGEQDPDDYRSQQQQVGGTFVYGAGGSVSYGRQKVDSAYASVREQTGIAAGGRGFDIYVGDNTHLAGGVIASTADPSLNRLSTGSLTVQDIENELNASARGSSFGASTDMLSGSKYAAAKGAGANLLGSGRADENRVSATRSGISEGAIDIRNGDVDVLASLDRTVVDLEGAEGLSPVDLSRLQQNVEREQVAKQIVYDQAVRFTDEAHRTMFLREAELFELVTDENG